MMPKVNDTVHPALLQQHFHNIDHSNGSNGNNDKTSSEISQRDGCNSTCSRRDIMSGRSKNFRKGQRPQNGIGRIVQKGTPERGTYFFAECTLQAPSQRCTIKSVRYSRLITSRSISCHDLIFASSLSVLLRLWEKPGSQRSGSHRGDNNPKSGGHKSKYRHIF